MQRRLTTCVDLGGREPLVRGHMRDIYEHPDYDDVLIKVIRPDRIDGKGDFIPWRRKRLSVNRTFGIYISYFREIKELLRASRNVYPRLDFPLPFARVHGLVVTPLGLGLVVQKIAAPDGSLAPTLAKLVKQGRFDAQHRARLDEFFDLSARHHLVFGDLHASNLAWVEDDGGRFICVDGTGEKALIPVHEWSRLANAMKLRRTRRRILSFIGRHAAQSDRHPGAALTPAFPRS